jgi:hypothetical protein
LIGAEEVLAIKTPYGYMVGKFYDLFITYSWGFINNFLF